MLNITAILNTKDYGFSRLTVHNATALSWEFIRGSDGEVGDKLTILKRESYHGKKRSPKVAK